LPEVPNETRENADGSDHRKNKSGHDGEAEGGEAEMSSPGGNGSQGGNGGGTGDGARQGQGNQAQPGNNGKPGGGNGGAEAGVGTNQPIANPAPGAANASAEDSSSPLVPILIAIVVLAAISIGAFYFRQRRQSGDSPVSPRAS
jgi:hypothetical protein